MTQGLGHCTWYATCTNPAVGLMPWPGGGEVTICERCRSDRHARRNRAARGELAMHAEGSELGVRLRGIPDAWLDPEEARELAARLTAAAALADVANPRFTLAEINGENPPTRDLET